MDKKTRELGKAWKLINESWGPSHGPMGEGMSVPAPEVDETVETSAQYMLDEIQREEMDILAQEDGQETYDRLKTVQEILEDMTQFGSDYPQLKERTIQVLKELKNLAMELSNMPKEDFGGVEEEMHNLANTVETVVGELNEGEQDLEKAMTPEVMDQVGDAVEKAEAAPEVKKAEQEVEKTADEVEQEGLNESYGWGYDGEIVM